MTQFRCDLCSEFFESGRLFVAAQASACNSCISDLIDNESSRRGEQADAQTFAQYHGGSGSDKERQDMIEAGRIR